MKAIYTIAVACAIVATTVAQANVIHSDSFSGNSNANLAAQTFNTGAATDFNFFAIGSGGNMDAGQFSVVNKAFDVHGSFSTSLDADNNINGHYAVYNGFSNADGLAYSKTVNVNVGDTVTVSAYFLTLAANPPFPQDSWIDIKADGVTLGSTINLVPVPAGTETWTLYSRSFVATTSSVTIDFVNLGSQSNAGNDFGIDNVSIEAVPEPATMTILGLIAAIAARKKRS
jgi:hypothetical protein